MILNYGHYTPHPYILKFIRMLFMEVGQDLFIASYSLNNTASI